MGRLKIRQLTFGADTEIMMNEKEEVWKETCNKPHDNRVEVWCGVCSFIIL